MGKLITYSVVFIINIIFVYLFFSRSVNRAPLTVLKSVPSESNTDRTRVPSEHNAGGTINTDGTIEMEKKPVVVEQSSRKQPLALIISLMQKLLGNKNQTQAPTSTKCLNDTMHVFRALAEGTQWATDMFDAAGKLPSGLQIALLAKFDEARKIPSGLLQGELTSLGSYDQCLEAEPVIYQGPHMTNPVKPFKTQYCKVTWKNLIEGHDIIMGVCVPSSCLKDELLRVIKYVLSQIPKDPFKDVKVVKPFCQLEKQEYDVQAIVVLCILGLFILLMALATLYDILVYQKLNKNPHSKWELKLGGRTVNIERLGQLLLAFSLYTNGSKLLSTHQNEGTLTAVDGIRFFSNTWVILGHSFGSIMSTAANRLPFFLKLLKRVSFQPIANASVSVDSFYALSGLLVAYLGLKELQKVGGPSKFSWSKFYFHRFWRLTPPYMLLLLVWASLYPYISNGPNWLHGWTEQKQCGEVWWMNLLYINNFYRKKTCMGWCWYLANDMQFYILSPLMLIPLSIFPFFGGAVCLTFLLGTTLTAGIMSSIYDWPAGSLMAKQGLSEDKLKARDYVTHYYYRPYCRMGPYIVGIIFGYLLYKTNCKFKMSTRTNLIGWTLAAVICLSVVYGPYGNMNGIPNSTVINALHNALSRSAWAFGVCWVIFACSTGYGGIVNSLLSWKAFVPLARLTYCAYLVHVMVQSVYRDSKRDYIHITEIELIYRFLGDLVISYGVAFVVSMSFEAPFIGLEKALFQSKRERPVPGSP